MTLPNPISDFPLCPLFILLFRPRGSTPTLPYCCSTLLHLQPAIQYWWVTHSPGSDDWANGDGSVEGGAGRTPGRDGGGLDLMIRLQRTHGETIPRFTHTRHYPVGGAVTVEQV